MADEKNPGAAAIVAKCKAELMAGSASFILPSQTPSSSVSRRGLTCVEPVKEIPGATYPGAGGSK